MPQHAEEVRPALREPAGDEDARYEFGRDVEASRITAEQREQLRTVTRDVLRQNAGRDLSPVFASVDVGPIDVATVAAGLPARVNLGGIQIDEYLACLGYVAPMGRTAPTMAEAERAAAREADQALRIAARAQAEAWERQRFEEIRRESVREYVAANWDAVLDRAEAAYAADPRREIGELLRRHGREPRARRTA